MSKWKKEDSLGLVGILWAIIGVIGIFGTIDLEGIIGEVFFPIVVFFGFTQVGIYYERQRKLLKEIKIKCLYGKKK